MSSAPSYRGTTPLSVQWTCSGTTPRRSSRLATGLVARRLFGWFQPRRLDHQLSAEALGEVCELGVKPGRSPPEVQFAFVLLNSVSLSLSLSPRHCRRGMAFHRNEPEATTSPRAPGHPQSSQCRRQAPAISGDLGAQILLRRTLRSLLWGSLGCQMLACACGSSFGVTRTVVGQRFCSTGNEIENCACVCVCVCVYCNHQCVHEQYDDECWRGCF